jgi:hypothetical protein
VPDDGVPVLGRVEEYQGCEGGASPGPAHRHNVINIAISGTWPSALLKYRGQLLQKQLARPLALFIVYSDIFLGKQVGGGSKREISYPVPQLPQPN